MLPGLTGLAGLAAFKITTLAFQTSATDITNVSTYTFSSQPFGTASTDRVVIVTITATQGVNGTISSVTIGGVSASIIAQQSSGVITCGIAAAVVPTGTTGDVVVNTSTVRDECAIGIWSSTGLAGAVAVASGSNTNLDALTLNAEAGGFVIAVCANDGDETTTWSGATEAYDVSLGEYENSSGASDIVLSSSVTVQPTLSGATSPVVFIAATF